MTTAQDVFVALKKETTYGEAVTPDYFPEFLEETFDQGPNFVEGGGLRHGRVGQGSDRYVRTRIEPAGDLTLEAFLKGTGKLFEAALGTGASANVSGSVYQQLFTPKTSDPMPSYTIQKALPVGTGSLSAETFTGMVCSGFELAARQGEVVQLKFPFMGKDVTTATAAAEPSYIAANRLFTYVHGAITLGGSVTVPTGTALASGGTSFADVRDITITWDNGLDSDGFNLGGAGKRTRAPRLGKRVGTGTMTVEYNSDTLRDAYLNETELALTLTFTHGTAIASTYYPTLQIVAPVIRLDGDIPKSNGGNVITQTVPFKILDGRVATHMLYVAIRTAETAI